MFGHVGHFIEIVLFRIVCTLLNQVCVISSKKFLLLLQVTNLAQQAACGGFFH